MVFPKRMGWRLAALSGACLVVAALLVISGRDVRNQPQTLPDGSVLTLVQFDYGKTNSWREGNVFQKMFRRHLPDEGVGVGKLRLMPPDELAGVESTFEALHVWARIRWPAGTHEGQGDGNWYIGKSRAVVFNELGNEYDVDSGGSDRASPSSAVWVWEATAFPRNGKTVGLRLLRESGSNQWSTLAEFVMPNPAPNVSTDWTPGSLPIAKQAGPVKFELEDLQAGRDFGDFPDATGRITSRAVFRITENGKPSEGWDVFGQSVISEGNGNFYEPDDRLLGQTNGLGFWGFDHALSSREPWKLKLGFLRIRDFSAADLHEVTNLPMPAPGSRSAFTTNSHGVTLEVSTFGAAPTVLVKISNLNGERSVRLLKFTGDQGQLVESETEGTPDVVSQRIPVAQLKGCKSFGLTLAISRPVYVEFIAKPRWIAVTNVIMRFPKPVDRVGIGLSK